jgi:hypothetical protein
VGEIVGDRVLVVVAVVVGVSEVVGLENFEHPIKITSESIAERKVLVFIIYIYC